MEKQNLLKATHEGTLNIGGAALDVAVLEDGTRIITQSAVFKALDRPVRGNARVINVPVFMDAQNLQPFISEDLRAVINKVEYIGLNGKKQEGFDATILPLVSDLYLKARENGAIKLRQQLETAQKAEILVRSLAKVGIIALVDEATQYEYVKEKFELQKILNAYIADEILKWQLTFKNDFYQQVFRLWGLPFIPKYIKNKPSFIGNLTIKYIYEQLPPGVLDKIREKTGKTKGGNWKYQWHRNLTEEVGREHLKKQIIEVTLLMEMSETKADFEKLFQKKYKQSPQLEFEFKDEPTPEPPKPIKLSDFNQKLKIASLHNPNANKAKPDK